MNKILSIILLFISVFMYGQSPSFSQFDLNMMSSNPAMSGFEGGIKTMLHSRSQWNDINENFNNSIFEISTNINNTDINNRIKTSYAPGIGVISEDLGFIHQGNTVFINKTEVSLYPLTLHKRIDFQIRNLVKVDNLWGSVGFGIHRREYSLNRDQLIFPDQWDLAGVFSPSTGANIMLPSFSLHDDPKYYLSAGWVVTRQGRYQSTRGDRLMLGWSINDVGGERESFTGSAVDSKIPLRQIIHAEWLRQIPKYRRSLVPYFKTSFKHERYIETFKPWTWQKSVMSKTEFGVSVLRRPIELGSLLRIRSDYNIQTWIFPLIRVRFNNIAISYSFDQNFATNREQLIRDDTGETHEIGLTIYFNRKQKSGKNPKSDDCPGFMDNSVIKKDLY